jgi:hypothetical protein
MKLSNGGGRRLPLPITLVLKPATSRFLNRASLIDRHNIWMPGKVLVLADVGHAHQCLRERALFELTQRLVIDGSSAV